MVKLEISGLNEARRQLRALGRNFDRQIVRPALLRGIQPMHERVKDEVPHLSGVLAEHIEVTAPLPNRGHTHVSVAINDVEYAGHRDLGTHDLVKNDFMERAFTQTAGRVASISESEIRKGLDT